MWQSGKTTLRIISCVLMIANVLVVISAIILTLTPNTVQTKRLKEVYNRVYEKLDFHQDQFDYPSLSSGGTDDVDDPDLQFLNLLKPVVHFSGLDLDLAIGDAGREVNLTILRNWANPDGSDRKLLYNGMRYENGSITVPAAGVYHITSHVKFYTEDNRKDDKPLRTFQHQVVRYSAANQTQVVLFENAVTECKEGINDGAHLEYPSGAGGLAQLDAGDNIIVKVSHLHLLKHDRDWHLVDMYLV